MFENATLSAIRSAQNVARQALDGRIRFSKNRVGDVLLADSGQAFTVYRETTVAPEDGDPPPSPAVLAFRFHLRFTPDRVAPLATRIFEPLSIVTTPFFAGLPGFRTKLWMFDHETGDYQGVYQWDTAGDAREYARALETLLNALSVPGSVSYEVVEGRSLEAYVADHATPRGASKSPRTTS